MKSISKYLGKRVLIRKVGDRIADKFGIDVNQLKIKK